MIVVIYSLFYKTYTITTTRLYNAFVWGGKRLVEWDVLLLDLVAKKRQKQKKKNKKE
jgi:hypothetical protein